MDHSELTRTYGMYWRRWSDGSPYNHQEPKHWFSSERSVPLGTMRVIDDVPHQAADCVSRFFGESLVRWEPV